jgi:alkylation response protein AidB-like acyl-CoA dehydrogenase
MNLEMSEEQAILARSVESWLRENYAMDRWRVLTEASPGYSEENWRAFAEMGWLGLSVPEEYGGFGGDATDLMLLGERFGQALVVEPFFSTVVLGAKLIERAGTQKQKSDWLPRIAGGTLKVAFAFAEPDSHYVVHHAQCQAKKSADGYRLAGRKIMALDAPHADLVIVLARVSGGPAERSGLGLFVVEANGRGVDLKSYRTLDRRRGADVAFADAPVIAVLGEPEGAMPFVDEAVDGALAYLAAESVGTMEAALKATSEYVKARKQFGSALADFQVIQHRIVNMKIEIENTRSLALYAALATKMDAVERARAAAAAKVQTSRSGRFVGQQAVQLHGGMGMTDAMSPGHYMKRLMAADTLFGDGDYHQRRFTELGEQAA